jgi:hypothetical protein
MGMPLTGRSLIVTFVAALAACTAASSGGRAEPPAESRPGAGLQVTVDAPGRALVLANGDTATIYFRAFEQRFATLVNWRPCAGPDGCPSVPPAGRTRVAFDSIRGYDSDAREVIVYWWKLRQAPEGTRPDSVRSRIVPISPAAR